MVTYEKNFTIINTHTHTVTHAFPVLEESNNFFPK